MEIITFTENIGKFVGTEDFEAHIDYLIDYFYKMKENHPVSDSISVRRGWQNHNLMTEYINEKEIHYLLWYINQQFETYFASYNPSKEYFWSVNNMWVNILPKGGYNRVHRHTGCQFSGIVYLQGDEDSGELTIFNPMNTKNISQNFTGFQEERTCYHIPPLRNTGVFFSSSLDHRVDMNNSDLDRISVAFNIRINDFPPASS